MKSVLKIGYFYGLWYFCAWCARENLHLWALGVSGLSVLADYALHRYELGWPRYASFVLFLCVSGPCLDLTFKGLGLFSWPGNGYPWAMVGIWLFFGVYYPSLFAWFRQHLIPSFFLGAIFGPAAYYSGHLIGALQWQEGATGLLLAFAVAWGAYFVGSLQLFNWLNRPRVCA